MSQTLIYSAEELRELLSSCAPQVTNQFRPQPLSAPMTESQAALLTGLNDRKNLEMLMAHPLVTCVLPVRDETIAADVADRAHALDKVIGSSEGSIILAGHDENTAAERRVLSHSSERWKLIEDFGNFARTLPCFADFPEICMTVCSELVTNAFYNAPRDAHGNPLVTDRKVDVSLTKPVNVTYGRDDKYLWVHVRDPFGTFSREALLRSLIKSSDGENLVVNMTDGGAGIGLYLVFRWSAQLLFTFNPQRETGVLAKLLITKRYKTFDSQRAIFELLQTK